MKEENKEIIKKEDSKDSSSESNKNSTWKVAKKSKKQRAAETVVRKISKVLALAALVAMAAKAGYEYGYNSEFAKHFWDNTKMRMEEQRKEREALKPKILNEISIEDDGERE